MTNISEFPSPQLQREVEASDWAAKLGRGLSKEEEFELGKWLSENPANSAVFMELVTLWDKMDALARLAEIFPEPKPKRKPVIGKPIRLASASLIVAVSAVWIGGMLLSNVAPESRSGLAAPEIEYQTAIGEQSSHTLSDGTVIVLNTNSQVRAQYSDSNRLLRLERGEVHIKVAHDRSRPFSVVVGDKVVQAVGTEFNVEITDDQSIELVVTEGIVLVGIVNSQSVASASDSPLILENSSRLVAAGEEASIKKDASTIDTIDTEPIKSDEIAVKLSWREGNLIFRGESLEEAVTEIERYTPVEFVFMDDESKKVRVAGLFKAGDVNGLLAALRDHFKITYEWQGDNKILLSSK